MNWPEKNMINNPIDIEANNKATNSNSDNTSDQMTAKFANMAPKRHFLFLAHNRFVFGFLLY